LGLSGEVCGRGLTGAAVAVLEIVACCSAGVLLAAGAVGGCVAGGVEGVVGVLLDFGCVVCC
jgi:hypothetical protein